MHREWLMWDKHSLAVDLTFHFLSKEKKSSMKKNSVLSSGDFLSHLGS